MSSRDSGKARVNATRTAALAAANKLMERLKLGPFTEFEIDDSTQQVYGYVCITIDGRISKSDWQMTRHAIIPRRGDDDSPGYRARLIYISTPDPERKQPSDPWLHFLCLFQGFDITIKKINESPFGT